MTARRTLPASLVLIAVAGCASPSYVDKGRGETGWLGINEVAFQVYPAYQTTMPDCVAILPLAVAEPSQPTATPEDAARIRLSIYAHLATQSKREIRLERVDHVLAEVKGDRKALGERLGCAALIEGEVIEYGSVFLGVYSRVAVGAKLRMVRATDGALLWEGSHSAASHGGNVPLDPVGIAMAVAAAAGNLRDEQILRVTDDLARRLTSTIPDNWPIALDDPAGDRALRKPAAPPLDDVTSGEALLVGGDHAGALAAAERAVAADPGRAEAWFLKGRVLLLERDYKGAEPAILKAVALDGGNVTHLNALGAVNAERGALDRALAAYRMAVSRDPDDGFAWYNAAIIHFNTGNAPAAADAFTRAARAYVATGDYAKAERALADLRDLAWVGEPVPSRIKAIESSLSDVSRRKT